MIYNNLCPQWNEFFRVSVCHHAKRLLFRVKDQDELGTDNVGEVSVALKDLLAKPGMKIHGKNIGTIRDESAKMLNSRTCYICLLMRRNNNKVKIFWCDLQGNCWLHIYVNDFYITEQQKVI